MLTLDSISDRLELPLVGQGSFIHRHRRGHDIFAPTGLRYLPCRRVPVCLSPSFPRGFCFWDDPSARRHAVDTYSVVARGEPAVGYPVPRLRLSSSLGSYCSPGYFGVLPGSRNVASSLGRVASALVSPCPFWTKPIAFVGLSSVTTNHHKFVFLSMPNCARRDSR